MWLFQNCEYSYRSEYSPTINKILDLAPNPS